ncbi:MAG TPA: YbaL family putative K(+) efflux transporter [Steroidobacteraceae bacterium]|nr:YbaL family putative K(+) efflux transporter [Steroidobacteraceae bacterium]
MDHSTPLIATIVGGLGLAFVLGAIASRCRMSPIVGYLLAGVAVGPFTPGYVADQSLANQLAEIGVILLMFGVGMHFSVRDLLSVRAIALPGAIFQIAVATLLGVLLGHLLGWSLGAGIIFGLALSVASTVVLLRALEERGLVTSERGRIAIGWLIVEDIAMVLVLVLLPVLGDWLGPDDGAAAPDARAIAIAIGITLAKVAGFVALILVVGRRVIPWVLHSVAQQRELFRLAVLAIALGVAFGAAKLFGVSFALGAFFAGIVLGESEMSHRAAEDTLPLREAFAVLFFVAVGMLFDPSIVLREPVALLGALFIVLIGKSVAAFVIVLLFRHTVGVAMTIAASLSQIGEFSFILIGLGLTMGILPEQGRDLVLATAMISIILNPFAFGLSRRVEPHIEARVKWRGRRGAAAIGRAAAAPLAGHSVLVGCGRVGSIVATALGKAGAPFVVIETDSDRVTELRDSGFRLLEGNAVNPEVLRSAGIARASQLVIAIPNAFEAGRIAEQARAINPGVTIIARAHSDAEIGHLQGLGADMVIMGERQIALEMLSALGVTVRPVSS